MTTEKWRVPAALLARLAGVPLRYVVGLALVLRLVADLAFSASGTDQYEFGVLAENLTDGRGYSYFGATEDGVAPGTVGDPLPSAFMPPLWTGLVALAHLGADLAGGGDALVVWLVRLVNLALAAVAVIGMDRLGREAWSPAAGRLAALAFAAYPPLLYLSTQVSAANAYLPLEIWLLVLGMEVARRPTTRGVVAMAVATGVLCLLRAEGVLFVGLLTLWLLVTWPGARRGAVRVACLFLVVAAVLPGAWLVRNSVTMGQPVLTITTTGGFNLWIGNHEDASGSQKTLEGEGALAGELAGIPASQDYEVQRDAAYRDAALEHITGEPGTVLLRDLKKVGMLLTVDWYDERSANPAYIAAYGVLLILGSAGLVRFVRRPPEEGRRGRTSLLVLYAGIAIVVPAVFFTLARYKLPIEMLLLLGVGILLAGERARDPGRHAMDASAPKAV